MMRGVFGMHELGLGYFWMSFWSHCLSIGIGGCGGVSLLCISSEAVIVWLFGLGNEAAGGW